MVKAGQPYYGCPALSGRHVARCLLHRGEAATQETASSIFGLDSAQAGFYDPGAASPSSRGAVAVVLSPGRVHRLALSLLEVLVAAGFGPGRRLARGSSESRPRPAFGGRAGCSAAALRRDQP